MPNVSFLIMSSFILFRAFAHVPFPWNTLLHLPTLSLWCCLNVKSLSHVLPYHPVSSSTKHITFFIITCLTVFLLLAFKFHEVRIIPVYLCTSSAWRRVDVR